MNDISPICIASKKNQANNDDIIENVAIIEDDRDFKQTRPKAKGKLKSNAPNDFFRGRYYADSRKTEESILNTRLKGLTLEPKSTTTNSQVTNKPPQLQSSLQEQSTIITQANPFCIGVRNLSHQGVKKPLHSNHSESTTRRGGKSGGHGQSPSKPVTFVDALYKIKLTPESETKTPSPTTRMKIKDRMKNCHKTVHNVSSNSKSLHRQSSEQSTEDGSKQAEGDDSPGNSKYRAMGNATDVYLKNKKSAKQKTRNKFIVNLSDTFTTMTILDSDKPSSNSQLFSVDDSHTTALIQSRNIKLMESKVDGSANSLPTVARQESFNEPEDAVKSKPLIVPKPDKILLPMDEVVFSNDENAIMMSETDFYDTQAIDQLIAKLTEFSIDHCLFFHSKLGKNVFRIEQVFKLSSLNSKKRSFQYITLLHMAAQCGRLHSVKHLIKKHSARVDAQDCCGRTPLMSALSSPAIVRYLITVGADINHRDRNGICPLSLLVSSTNPCKETLLILIKAGADLLLVDMFGRSILYHALVGSNKEIINILLEACPFLPNSRVGQFTFAGKPLLAQWQIVGTVNMSVKYVLKLPDSLKLSVEYLNAVTFSDSDANEENLKVAHAQLKMVLTDKEKLDVTIDYPLPLSIYNNRKEVQTVEELEKISPDDENRGEFYFEMAFQCLLIAERILGHASYNSIGFLHFIIEDLMRGSSKTRTDVSLPSLWGQFIQMLAHHVEQTKASRLIKTHLLYAVSNVKNITFEDGETKKYQNLLLQALVTFYRNLIFFHHHEGEENIFEYNYHMASDFLKYLLDFGDSSQVSTFLDELPEHPAGMRLIELVLKINSNRDSNNIDKCLEMGGAKLLNVPDYCLGQSLLHKYDLLNPTCREMIVKLIMYGAHPDIVDKGGFTAWAKMKNPTWKRRRMLQNQENSNAKEHDLNLQTILNKPSSLYCLAANALISFKFPYRALDLPQHVISFISMHDKDTYPIQRMKQQGLIHHGFKFEDDSSEK